MKTDWRIVIFGLGCITVLEAIALFNGINGVILTSVIAVIAGAIGLTLPQWRIK
tara:strand:+ start:980 stop:1141 length:162 start_codon:yes stop_codon:yes gene_type:complete